MITEILSFNLTGSWEVNVKVVKKEKAEISFLSRLFRISQKSRNIAKIRDKISVVLHL